MPHFLVDKLEDFKVRWLPQGSVRRRYASGVFWTFVGTVFARGLGLLTSIVVARFLGKVGFGELGIINSTVGAFSAVGGLGAGLTATKYVAELRHKDSGATGRTIGLATLVALVSYGILSSILFLSAPLIATKALNAPSLASSLRIGSALLFLSGIDGVQIGVLSGFEAFQEIARITLLRGLITLPLTSILVWLYGLDGAVGAMAAVALVSLYWNWLAVKRVSSDSHVNITYRANWTELHILWRFSFPAFLVSLFSLPTTWVVNALLVNQANGYAEMGILNAAYQWRAVAILIPLIFSPAGVAIQSNLFGNGARESYKKLLTYNMLFQVGGTTLVIMVLVLVAPWILLAYGKSFSDGVIVFYWLASGWVFMAASSVFWDAMVSMEKIWWGMTFNLISTVVLLVCAVKFVAAGARGISMAYLCSYVSLVLVQVVYFLFHTKRGLLQR